MTREKKIVLLLLKLTHYESIIIKAAHTREAMDEILFYGDRGKADTLAYIRRLIWQLETIIYTEEWIQ